jgi:hypothetical protein
VQAKCFTIEPQAAEKITIKQAISLVNGEKRKRPDDFVKRLAKRKLPHAILRFSKLGRMLKKTNGGT